jgi:GT2 family glycosyltransferase
VPALRLVALMAVHDRRDQTERCLRLLDTAAAGLDLVRVIVDDGSTDGTAQLLERLRRPDDVIVRGPGDLFWAGGMRRGFEELDALEPFDHLLLLNDDVVLRPDALQTLLERTEGRRDRLVVGVLVDPVTGVTTYGGYRGRTRWRPLSYTLVTEPDDLPVEGMNANAVLVGHDAYRRLGGFSTTFRHGFADFDYALRANSMGIEVLLSLQPVGECARNPVAGTWRDPSLSRRARVRLMCSPKGMPPREWLVFCWRHGGVAGLRYFAWTWVTVLRHGARTGN